MRRLLVNLVLVLLPKLCVALLVFNSAAFAGGLQHGIISKAKRIGIGALAIGMFACGTISCSKDKAVNEAPKQEVAVFSYDQSTTVNELIADIKQLEGTQIGVVRSVDYSQGAISIETADEVVSMRLAKGEVLVNNTETPLEIILSEEAFDEGLIAEGSWIAIIPGVVVTASGFAWAGMAFVTGAAFKLDRFEIDLLTVVPPIVIGLAAGLGTYHALVML